MSGSNKGKKPVVVVWYGEHPEEDTKPIAERIKELCGENGFEVVVEEHPTKGKFSYLTIFERQKPRSIGRILDEFEKKKGLEIGEFKEWAVENGLPKRIRPLADLEADMDSGEFNRMVDKRLEELKKDYNVMALFSLHLGGEEVESPRMSLTCDKKLKEKLTQLVGEVNKGMKKDGLSEIKFEWAENKCIIAELFIPESCVLPVSGENKRILELISRLNEAELVDIRIGSTGEVVVDFGSSLIALVSILPGLDALFGSKEDAMGIRRTRFRLLESCISKTDIGDNGYKRYAEVYAKTLSAFIGKLF